MNLSLTKIGNCASHKRKLGSLKKLEPMGFPGLGWASAAPASDLTTQCRHANRHFGLQPEISEEKSAVNWHFGLQKSLQRSLCWKMLVYGLLLLPTLGQAANPALMSSSWVGFSLFNCLPLFSFCFCLFVCFMSDCLSSNENGRGSLKDM